MECTNYYEIEESIYTIDSNKGPTYGEINIFCAWISIAPHITIMFTIIVVDLPPAYGVVLGWNLCSTIGGYIMNYGSWMMLPNKDGTMIKVPREHRNPSSFKKKETEMMQSYIDAGIANYVFSIQNKWILSSKMKKILFKVFGKCHLMVLALSLESELVLFLKVLNHAFIHMKSYLSSHVLITKHSMEH